MSIDILIWQLVDSAFPSGALAHSAGLEAAWRQGAVTDDAGFFAFVQASLAQIAGQTGPFVAAAARAGACFDALDELCGAMLLNHVARRASLAQGRAFLFAAKRTFDHPSITTLEERVLPQADRGHHGPVFGAVLAALGVSPEKAVELFLFCGCRQIHSAAVRLGIVGPLEAQRSMRALAAVQTGLAAAAMATPVEEAASCVPMIDLWQGNQDRLYSRLFQS